MRGIIFCCILINAFYSWGQNNVPFDKNHISDKAKLKVVKDSLKKGDYFFKGEYYKQALLRYEYAQNINPDNADLNFKIGICYLNSATKDKARPFFEKALLLNPKINEDIKYYLGRASIRG